MRPRDFFGVLALLGGLLYLYSAIVASFAPDTPYASSPLSYIGACIVTLIFSVYFLRGAPHLVRFAYGPESND